METASIMVRCPLEGTNVMRMTLLRWRLYPVSSVTSRYRGGVMKLGKSLCQTVVKGVGLVLRVVFQGRSSQRMLLGVVVVSVFAGIGWSDSMLGATFLKVNGVAANPPVVAVSYTDVAALGTTVSGVVVGIAHSHRPFRSASLPFAALGSEKRHDPSVFC